MRRLAMVAPLAVLLTTALTAGIVLLGPEPYRPATHPDILETGGLLIEPRDRLVLAAWWLIVVVIVVLLRDRGGPSGHPRSPRAPDALVTGVVTLTIGLATIAVLVDVDQRSLWPGIGWPGLLVGTGLAALTILQWRAARRVSLLVTLAMLAMLAMLAVPALLETPGGIRDVDSFRFTGDELAAVANGQFPLVDYFPQYTNLLGIPIAPAIRVLPDQAVWIILLWVLALQLTTLLTAICLPIRQSGWRMTMGSALVVVAPVVASNPRATSAATYFGVLPLRVFLPTVTIALAYGILGRERPEGRRSALLRMGLGLACGVTMLNNLDFGAPLAVVVICAGVLAQRSTARRLRVAAAIAAGALLPGLAYLVVATVSGRTIDWYSALIYPRVFGAEGYFAVAMRPFGLHIAVVALFASATAMGVLLLTSPGIRAGSWTRRQGLLLLLTGGWSLLCLPYFASRSYTSTLVGGYAFNIGLVTAAFLPLVRAGQRHLTTYRLAQPRWLNGSLGLGVLAMAACMGCLVLVYPPAAYVSRMEENGVTTFAELHDVTSAVTTLLADPPAQGITHGISTVDTEQLLDMPALVSLQTGLRAHPAFNSPEYTRLSRSFSAVQCASGWSAPTRYLVLSAEVAAAMRLAPECEAALDFDRAEATTGVARELIVVPLHGVREP